MNNEFFSELRQIFGQEIGAGHNPQPSSENPHLNNALRGTEAGTSPPFDEDVYPQESEQRCPMFAEDFHPLYGERLCVFPRSAQVEVPAYEYSGYELTFWPDLNTFTDTYGVRQMMYYPPGPSRFSLLIVWEEESDYYRSALFEDFQCVHEGEGEEIARILRSA